jgi:hypothetical protein
MKKQMRATSRETRFGTTHARAKKLAENAAITGITYGHQLPDDLKRKCVEE